MLSEPTGEFVEMGAADIVGKGDFTGTGAAAAAADEGGITAAGGTGYYLAQMMVNGEAEIDMASLDPKRYGNWMTTEYAARKNEECYDHVFILHHPDEEREACRPLRTSPSYDREKASGAQFGQVNGWERPNYYAPMGFDDHGPIISSRGRGYRPAVPWVCAGLLLVALISMWQSKAFSRSIPPRATACRSATR